MLILNGVESLISPGQSKKESGTFAQFTFHPNHAAVGLDNVLDDGQPKAGAAGFP